jgi:hypothetical protein
MDQVFLKVEQLLPFSCFLWSRWGETTWFKSLFKTFFDGIETLRTKRDLCWWSTPYSKIYCDFKKDSEHENCIQSSRLLYTVLTSYSNLLTPTYIHEKDVRHTIYLDDGRITAETALKAENPRVFVHGVWRPVSWRITSARMKKKSG